MKAKGPHQPVEEFGLLRNQQDRQRWVIAHLSNGVARVGGVTYAIPCPFEDVSAEVARFRRAVQEEKVCGHGNSLESWVPQHANSWRRWTLSSGTGLRCREELDSGHRSASFPWPGTRRLHVEPFVTQPTFPVE